MNKKRRAWLIEAWQLCPDWMFPSKLDSTTDSDDDFCIMEQEWARIQGLA